MSAVKKARLSTMTSWIEVAADSDFPIQNLPWGVVSVAGGAPFCATIVGDTVINLSVLANAGLLPSLGAASGTAFAGSSMNAFMALGKAVWVGVRGELTALFSADGATAAALRDDAALRGAALVAVSECVNLMPATIGDYTDFYASREHATNVGTMFRGVENALQPNWTRLPVGYHGRASSVVITGTDIRRPYGQQQIHPTDAKQGSKYGPCRLMDIELEVGWFVGTGNVLGDPIAIEDAQDKIFGCVLMNDWSMRDMQKWEYVPLGPFTGENIMTSISPWIVSIDALKPFQCPTSWGTQTDPVPLPYLRDPNYSSFDTDLKVFIKPHEAPADAPAELMTNSNLKYMYWSGPQMLTHHSVTGCNMRPGDLLGSGTISGTDVSMFGSMLEQCWKGTRYIVLPSGLTRKFLQDGDTVTFKGKCTNAEYSIGFGECTGTILPAHAHLAALVASEADGAASK